jgi:hypothetical protein
MGCDFISLDVMQVRYSAGRAVVHGPARLPTTVVVLCLVWRILYWPAAVVTCKCKVL